MDLGPAREPIVSNLNTLPEVTWIQPMPDGSPRARRRPGRRRGRARNDQARIRRRAPAPAAAAAGGADPLRGAALEGDGGRRAARDERRLGQQRAAARARDARRRATSAARRRADSAPTDRELLARYVEAFEALRHGRADLADPGGRDAVDAAVRPLAARPRRHLHVVVRARASAAAARASSRPCGERLAGVRPVQAEPPDGGYEPWALQVLEIEDGRIVEFTFFLDTETVFPLFGLPLRLDA